jgi:ABC-type nitrate/sulfonate/bicarbonate transport system substrate-binding protein
MTDALRVGVPYVGPSAIGWPLLAAEQLGMYTDEDLDVTLVPSSYDELSEGVTSGSLPIIRRGPDADIVLMELGAPIRIVTGLVGRPIGDIIARSSTTKIEELRGGTFGVIDERVGSTLQLKTVLAKAGIQPGSYTLRVYGGSPQRYQALLDGEIDAALLSPPTSRRALDAGMRQVAHSADYLPDYLSSSIQANIAFAEANADLVMRYIRATIRAIRWLYAPENRARAIALLDDGTDAAASTYHDVVDRSETYPRDGGVRRSALGALQQALRDMGDIGEPRLTPDEYVLDQFRAAAVATLDAAPSSEAIR